MQRYMWVFVIGLLVWSGIIAHQYQGAIRELLTALALATFAPALHGPGMGILTAGRDHVPVMLMPYDGVFVASRLSSDLPPSAPRLLGPRLADLVRVQSIRDLQLLSSVPLVEFDSENVLISPRFSILKVNKTLVTSATATIMTVADRAEFVLKYQVNCNSLGDVHPLISDFHFQRELHGLDVTPHAFFLSPPRKFESSITAKTNFQLKPEQRIACARHPQSAVRFMLMERAKYTIHDLIDAHHQRGERVPFAQALSVTENLIALLQTIHARGIVHGDIHSGNVAVIDRKGEAKVALIDFGLAFFEDDAKLAPSLAFAPMTETHCLFSHWNLLGFRFAFRDDVFKALLLGANLINGSRWWTYCSELESSADRMLRFKASEFFFAAPGLPDPIANLRAVSASGKAQIRAALNRALELIRGVNDIDQLPPYQSLIDALAGARRIIEFSSVAV